MRHARRFTARRPPPPGSYFFKRTGDGARRKEVDRDRLVVAAGCAAQSPTDPFLIVYRAVRTVSVDDECRVA